MGDLRDKHDREWYRGKFKVEFIYDSLRDDIPSHFVRYELVNVDGENAERANTQVMSSTPAERQAVREMMAREVTNQFTADNYFAFPEMASIIPQPEQVLSGTVVVQIEVLGGEDNTAFTVEFRTNGGNWMAAVYNSGTGYYEKSVNTTGLADGAYSFEFRAGDVSGILLESEPFNISVDNS